MSHIQTGELPHDALLGKYRQDGAYTDCYVVDVPRPVSQAEYVEAFYTSGVFRIERELLSLLAAKPATNLQARQLAGGEITTFSAWKVEGRTPNQLLLCDFLGRTRSWLMSAAVDNGLHTRLYFGSAVVPEQDPVSGRKSLGFAFHALLGFHRLYSRVLLSAARARLLRSGPNRSPD